MREKFRISCAVQLRHMLGVVILYCSLTALTMDRAGLFSDLVISCTASDSTSPPSVLAGEVIVAWPLLTVTRDMAQARRLYFVTSERQGANNGMFCS